MFDPIKYVPNDRLFHEILHFTKISIITTVKNRMICHETLYLDVYFLLTEYYLLKNKIFLAHLDVIRFFESNFYWSTKSNEYHREWSIPVTLLVLDIIWLKIKFYLCKSPATNINSIQTTIEYTLMTPQLGDYDSNQTHDLFTIPRISRLQKNP